MVETERNKTCYGNQNGHKNQFYSIFEIICTVTNITTNIHIGMTMNLITSAPQHRKLHQQSHLM